MTRVVLRLAARSIEVRLRGVASNRSANENLDEYSRALVDDDTDILPSLTSFFKRQDEPALQQAAMSVYLRRIYQPYNVESVRAGVENRLPFKALYSAQFFEFGA